jgi:hypothetical protein
MSDTKRTAYTQGLRAVADLIDAHPGLPEPYTSFYGSGNIDVQWYLQIQNQDFTWQKATAAKIVSDIGGKWNKRDLVEGRLDFEQTLDNGVHLTLTVSRDAVCERVVIGTHEVTIPETPAMPACDATPEHVKTVEDVKWVCSPLLAEPRTIHGTAYPRMNS